MEENSRLYRAFAQACRAGLLASAKGLYRGGLGVALAMAAMGGGLGAFVDLDGLPSENGLSPERKLFSESTGRFLVTVRPADQDAFEAAFAGLPCGFLGRVRADETTLVKAGGEELIRVENKELRAAFKKPFGHLI
jgi:phosphoribosylformylglycinamidine synthase